MEPDQELIGCIEDLRKIANSYESLMQMYAVKAIKNRSNKDNLTTAQEYAIKDEVSKETIDKAIDVVRKHWRLIRPLENL